MIVCSCNVFSDDDVRSAMAEAVAPARTAGEVYACLGCSPRCGRCAQTIKQSWPTRSGARTARAPASASCLHSG